MRRGRPEPALAGYTAPRMAENEPYEKVVNEHWDAILQVFQQFEDKNPILLFDVQEQRIYAYQHRAFAADLSAKDQAALERQHKKVAAGKSIVVFVRDNARQKLVSFTFAREAASRRRRHAL